MITYIIIALTVLVSFLCFQNHELFQKLKFNPVMVRKDKQYYRMITHAFVHVDWTHLLVNMFVLYFFGRAVEYYFSFYFGQMSTLFYILLYFGGIVVSNFWSLEKHKNNYNYNAVGASGAVSAVLFAFIFFAPWELLYFFGIIPIPGILFGIGYLYYSYKMTKQNTDQVAHDAHLLGAVFGFVLPMILKPGLLQHFIHELISIF
ncbi:membrane associated rhomboid family serine protease [Balneicella halophila]|uniref:Membrane associated rhomboid family serine protease n=1 Tax=Balneicella halophila TaxID=1537566 RepID=A0A7L4URS9_BALHA|nr:rhomboid family intramembrane serine protease [Balneicella halophila]PVX51029.1 membrane associated rhomboid family serine protease [Balneicella halophila]